MAQNRFNLSDKLRKERNRMILEKIKNGDSLQTYSNQQSWYPPRPIIKKDRKIIEKLYHTDNAS